jgi:hypothetical protein
MLGGKLRKIAALLPTGHALRCLMEGLIRGHGFPGFEFFQRGANGGPQFVIGGNLRRPRSRSRRRTAGPVLGRRVGWFGAGWRGDWRRNSHPVIRRRSWRGAGLALGANRWLPGMTRAGNERSRLVDQVEFNANNTGASERLQRLGEYQKLMTAFMIKPDHAESGGSIGQIFDRHHPIRFACAHEFPIGFGFRPQGVDTWPAAALDHSGESDVFHRGCG